MLAKDFRLFCISGHGEGDPGAVANGQHEADWNRIFMSAVHGEALRRGISSTLYDQNKNAYKQIKEGNMPAFAGHNLCIEGHFNSSTTQDPVGDNKMVGTMMYIKKDSKANSPGLAILNAVLGIGARKAWDGIVETTRSYPQGLLVQNRCESAGVPHILFEICFLSDVDDMRWFTQNKSRIAAVIVDALFQYYQLQEEPLQPKQLINGTVRVVYAGADGLNLHETPDFEESSVAGVIYAGEQRRAVTIITAANGESMYRLEDGQYVTAHGSYVQYTRNEFTPFVIETASSDQTLAVRDFPSSVLGNRIFTLYNSNLAEVIGEAYNYGDHWYMVRIKNDSTDLTGFVAARYTKRV